MLSLKLGRQLSVEQFGAAASQSAASSPPSQRSQRRRAARLGHVRALRGEEAAEDCVGGPALRRPAPKAPDVPLPQTCDFRACGRTCVMGSISRDIVNFPSGALQAQKWHVRGSRIFGAAPPSPAAAGARRAAVPEGTKGVPRNGGRK